MPQPGSYSQSEVNLSDDPSANRARKTKILEKISFYGGQALNEAQAKFLLVPPSLPASRITASSTYVFLGGNYIEPGIGSGGGFGVSSKPAVFLEPPETLASECLLI